MRPYLIGGAGADVLDGGPEKLALLGRFERAVLADGAEHDQPVAPGREHGVDVRQRPGDVEALVGVELRAHRGEHPAPGDGHVRPPVATRYLTLGA